MSNDIELYGDSNDVYLTQGDKMLFDEVDNIMRLSVTSGDPTIAMRFGSSLRKDARVRGVALAKLLWGIQDNWYLFESAGVEDSMINVIESEMGVSPATANVYIRTWEAVFANPDIPDNVKERLLCKPIRTLKLLPSLAGEGDDVDWNEIASAISHDDVRKIIKRVRGEQTSSNTALFIRLDSRTGQLSCRRGDGQFHPFGILNMELNDNEVVVSAIERIVNNARIMQV